MFKPDNQESQTPDTENEGQMAPIDFKKEDNHDGDSGVSYTIDSEMDIGPRDVELQMQQADGYIGDRSEIVENSAEKIDNEYKTFVGHMLMAPAFLIDNEFILHGYRINFNTKMKIFKSLFMLHNETVNVWSHLLGVFAFFAYFLYTVSSVYESYKYRDILSANDMFVTSSLDNRLELSLVNHSTASEMTDFQSFCNQSLNLSSAYVNASSASKSLSQYWTNEIIRYDK